MASGKQHYNYWKAFIPVAVAVSVLVTGLLLANRVPIWIGVMILPGYFLGRYLDPDLDLLGLSSAEGRLMRELKIIGVVITMWFLPYAYVMRFVGLGRKGHRNFFSHFPGVSTAIRLIWLLVPIYTPVIYFAGYQPGWLDANLLSGVWLGLTIADTIHYFADF